MGGGSGASATASRWLDASTVAAKAATLVRRSREAARKRDEVAEQIQRLHAEHENASARVAKARGAVKDKQRSRIEARLKKLQVKRQEQQRILDAAVEEATAEANVAGAAVESLASEQKDALGALTKKLTKGVKLRLDPEEFTDDERELFAERLGGEIIIRH